MKASHIAYVMAVILVIAVLALVAFMLLQGYNADSTSSSFRMESGACANVEGRNLISAQVTNLGKAALNPQDFTFSQIDGAAFSVGQVSILPGQSGMIEYDCGGQGCSPGSHTIVLGTTSGINTATAQCP